MVDSKLALRKLKMDEVTYSELKSGQKGISLGEEDWFLLVKKNGKWRFTLWSLLPYEALSSVATLNNLEGLRSSPHAKSIRDKIKSRWSNPTEIIESILIEIRYHPTDFVSGEVEEEEEKVIVRTPTLVTDNFIAEQVWQPPKPPQFIVQHFDKDTFTYKSEINLGETDLKGRPIVYQPIYNQHLRKGMVIIPRKPEPCTIEEVIREATEFVFSAFDPCGRENEAKLHILSAIASWILDKEKPKLPIAGIGVFAPILAIRGPSGSGKNRLANMLRFLSYHSFFDVSTYRIPSLYRPLDQWKGTLVVDEGDLKSTGETSSLIHFLNSRATGTPIGRQNPDRPSKCDAFESFGLTIITQRRHFDDNATEGRTIPLYTDVSEKDLPTLETEEMINRGMEFQDKLLYIRLKHWNDIQIEKTMWIPGVSDHRLNSALLPIMALAKFAPWLETFVTSIVEPIEKERRKLKAQSDDGVLINFLWEQIDTGLWDIHNGLYYVGEKREEFKGMDDEEIQVVKPLTASNIAETLKHSPKTIRKIIISLNMAPKETPRLIRVGKRPCRAIFFDPYRMEKRLKEFIIDYQRNELFEKLGIEKSVTDVTDVTLPITVANRQLEELPPQRESVTSVTSVTLEKNPPLRRDNLGRTQLERETEKELSWIVKREGDRVVTQTGEILYQCPACWKFHKQAFFSSQADLDTHLEQCHSHVPKSLQVQIPPQTNWEQAYAKTKQALKGKNFNPYTFQDCMNEFGFQDEKHIDQEFWKKVSEEQIIMNDDNTFHFTEAS